MSLRLITRFARPTVAAAQRRTMARLVPAVGSDEAMQKEAIEHIRARVATSPSKPSQIVVGSTILCGVASWLWLNSEKQKKSMCEDEDESYGEYSKTNLTSVIASSREMRSEIKAEYKNKDSGQTEYMSVKEFNGYKNSPAYQDAMRRLESIKCSEEFSKAWALRVREGREIDKAIDCDRGLCLELLYRLKDAHDKDRITDKEVEECTKDVVSRVLLRCIRLDRANALYHMKYNRDPDSSDHGMHWVSKQHLTGDDQAARDWRDLLDAKLNEDRILEFEGKRCTMNRRLRPYVELHGLIKEDKTYEELLTPTVAGNLRYDDHVEQPNDIAVTRPNEHRSLGMDGKVPRLALPSDIQLVHGMMCPDHKHESTDGLKRVAAAAEIAKQNRDNSGANEKGDPKDVIKRKIETSCMGNLVALGRSCRYKNSNRGLILFRGGRLYDYEKSSLMRISGYKKRKEEFRKLLVSLAKLRAYVRRNPGNMSEGQQSSVSTLRALALLQHYGEVAQVKTPLLDVTRSSRVAASFASHGDVGSGLERVVRMLLVEQPAKVEFLPVDDDRKEIKCEWPVRRLGKSKMLLAELVELLPPAAVRPQNQFGLIMVHEDDLATIHTLCLLMDTGEKVDLLMERDDVKALLGENLEDEAVGWDALAYDHLSIIMKYPSNKEEKFFHRDGAFPRAGERALYPIKAEDPMYGVMEYIFPKKPKPENKKRKMADP